MFLGSYVPSFDENSRRLALPKKIRDYLATSEVILSFGFEKCLFGFDTGQWEIESQRQLAMPLTDRRPRDLRRFIFANAATVNIDDQGRIVIPGNFLRYAKVTKPIVIGAGDHFEIWDELIWTKELKKLEKGKDEPLS